MTTSPPTVRRFSSFQVPPSTRWGVTLPLSLLYAVVVAFAGCTTADSGDPLLPDTPDPQPESGICSIPLNEIFDGGPGKDGIPALTNPEMVLPDDEGAEYVRDEDRVIGLVLDGQPFAIPHNVGWYHEIVNLDHGAHQVAVTYCPLTGSSIAFDRSAVGGAEFGVSGLLYKNNLIMYDRSTQESLWPQMVRGARCGPSDGNELPTVPVYEMSWGGWLSLYPNTLVVSRPFVGPYRVFPYGNYEDLTNSGTIFPVEIDVRRPAKERVLGIPLGSGGGIAFPFTSLADRTELRAVNVNMTTKSVVVLWDGKKSAAVAHEPRVGNRDLTIEVVGGRFVDVETQSVWSIDGRAVEGELIGQSLKPVPEAYVAFWFAWAAFHPETELWGPIQRPTR